MQLIALRPEYQLSVDYPKNRVFYQNFGQMQGATALPDYLADWAAALAEVRPGFSILSDMQLVNQVTPALQINFQAVEQLIVARGVCIVAEIHVPGQSARRHSVRVTTSQAMPVRQFLSLWEADQFLDDL